MSRPKVDVRATVKTATPSPVLERPALPPKSSHEDFREESNHSVKVEMAAKPIRSAGVKFSAEDTPIQATDGPAEARHNGQVHAESNGVLEELEADERPQKIPITSDQIGLQPTVPTQDESTTFAPTFKTCPESPPEELITEGVRGITSESNQPSAQPTPITYAFFPTGPTALTATSTGSAVHAVPGWPYFVPATAGPAQAEDGTGPQAYFAPFGTYGGAPPTATSAYVCSCGACGARAEFATPQTWSLYNNDGTLTHEGVQYKIVGNIGALPCGREYVAVESRASAEDEGANADQAECQGRLVGLKVMDKPYIYEKPGGRCQRLRIHRILTQINKDGRKWLCGVERSWSDALNVFCVTEPLACTLEDWISSSQIEDFPFHTYVAEMILILCDLHDSGIIHRVINRRTLKIGLDGHLCLDWFDVAVSRGESPPEYFPKGSLLYYTPPEVFSTNEVFPCSDMPPKAISNMYDVWCMGICILEMSWPVTSASVYDEDLLSLSSEELYKRLANPDLEKLASMRYLKHRNPTLFDLVQKMTDEIPLCRWSPDRLKTHTFFDNVDWEELAKRQPRKCALLQQSRMPLILLVVSTRPTVSRHILKGENPLYSDHLDKDGHLRIAPDALRGIIQDTDSDGDIWQWYSTEQFLKTSWL
ncbi:hypothetical protein EIP86_005850 [Pleurotus ostreatoroseus]|nr:hypothetical protein EIP86_005850 [Pleurotus ostreatoroseus]